ncbi:DNA polymerase III subunit gamma/tau [Cyanobacterium aponinum]|uniref:DNA polymerase III subunit gamma/tau n=1 Tax=Cyanobacterium aponinum TaxID=379064 RepID=UPI000C12DF37|nr:DNA polymerase III subunit gamma/tau [Cyanobacterium aponinum]PHV61804.1 DNA polymerase III subunit gamma/tau [Cyanobacterium aponinum IPPAS B-1201]
MNYEPLHHKYRPQTFSQLTGQEAIAQTLINAIKNEKIVPAYLFCGPRGTGKTSSARILAKSLNCIESDRPTAEPCGKCEVCKSISNGSALDVVEIDAASNTGVDNIREIIEKAQYAPVKCRYKVYVIDECHMLSTAAFNALLKTLEEPSPRVIFVLATTDPQRVLPTIISRCQRFDYRRIPLIEMVKHLQDIAIKENIDITPEGLSLVAQLANGGMRDAQTLLDQLSLLSGTITPERVWDLVGAVSEQDLLALISAIASDNPEEVIIQCRKLLDRGREPLIVLQNLANFYLTLLIAKTSPQKKELVAITDDTWQKLIQEAHQWDLKVILQGQKKLKDSEVQIRNTTQPRLWLEITLLSLLPSANAVTTVMVNNSSQTATAPLTQEKRVTQEKREKTTVETQTSQAITPPPEDNSTPQTPQIYQPSTPVNFDSYTDVKEKVIEAVTPTATKSFLRQSCHIRQIEGQTVTLEVASRFLLDIGKRQQQDIEAGFAHVYQKPMNVVFIENPALKNQKLDNNDNSPPQPTQPPTKPIENPSPTETKSSIPQTPVNQPVETAKIQPPSKPVMSSSVEINHEEFNTQLARNAAESVVKSFKGDIVFTETKLALPKIVNRPSIEISEDDDDIPF